MRFATASRADFSTDYCRASQDSADMLASHINLSNDFRAPKVSLASARKWPARIGQQTNSIVR